MQINLYSAFREAAGTNNFDLDLPEGSTVNDAIMEIVKIYPGLKKVWFKNDNELYGHVQISINQMDVLSFPDKYKTRLNPKDTLDFFPPIVGG